MIKVMDCIECENAIHTMFSQLQIMDIRADGGEVFYVVRLQVMRRLPDHRLINVNARQMQARQMLEQQQAVSSASATYISGTDALSILE